MSVKSVLLLVTVLVTNTNLEETQDNGFIVVSTTQRPSDPVVTTMLEKQLEFCTKSEEINRRLSVLEGNMTKTQRALENEQKINDELKQTFDKIQKTLEEKDQQISDIKKTLETLQARSEVLNQKLLENSIKATNESLPKNCKEVMERGHTNSGTYLIQPKSEAFTVLCDMASIGGGWTFFQSRFDGSQDFYLGWEDYKKGFGKLSGEFWIGLEHLHQLAGDENNELLIKLVDYQHKTAYAHYKKFGVGSEQEDYSLKFLDGYSGDAGDSLLYHSRGKFLTKDRQQEHNCAVRYEGAWWFQNCLYSNLNGKYLGGESTISDGTGINWFTFSTDKRSLLACKMMVRPR